MEWHLQAHAEAHLLGTTLILGS